MRSLMAAFNRRNGSLAEALREHASNKILVPVVRVRKIVRIAWMPARSPPEDPDAHAVLLLSNHDDRQLGAIASISPWSQPHNTCSVRSRLNPNSRHGGVHSNASQMRRPSCVPPWVIESPISSRSTSPWRTRASVCSCRLSTRTRSARREPPRRCAVEDG